MQHYCDFCFSSPSCHHRSKTSTTSVGNILALQKERLLTVLSKEPVVQFSSDKFSIHTRYTSFSGSICSAVPPVGSFSLTDGREKVAVSLTLQSL